MKKSLLLLSLLTYSQFSFASVVGCSTSGNLANQGFFSCDIPTATVSSGTEFNLEFLNADTWSVDIDANSVTLTALTDFSVGQNNLAQMVLNLTNIDLGSTLFSVSKTGFQYDIVDNVTLTNQILSVDFSDYSGTISSSEWSAGDQLVIAASVPEPTSLALLGLGLAGFGFSRKKKKA